MFNYLFQRAAIVANRYLHNANPFFYPLSPDLLAALVFAFRRLEKHNPELLRGGYYEFGVFKGFSIWFAERLTEQFAPEMKLYGFDSFEGLPKSEVDRNPFWKAGNYSASISEVQGHIKRASDSPSRITFVKGFFSKELFDGFLREHAAPAPSILVVDSDLYESCRCVLDFWARRMPLNSILILDECRNTEKYEKKGAVGGEKRAISEFLAGNPSFSIEHVMDYGRFGSVFLVKTV